MSWRRDVVLHCDLCGNEITKKGGSTVNYVRRLAWLHNRWRRLPDGRDLCNKCSIGVPNAR